MTTAFPANTNQNAHHNTEEYFMNSMMKIWKKYVDFTIQTKDKKYIFQRGHFAESSFAILLESRNFRGIKTKGLKKANDELTISEIHHNLKKLEKHTTNKFLKLVFNKVKKYKKENHKIDFFCIEKFKGKFII